jgi:hypothetical protein
MGEKPKGVARVNVTVPRDIRDRMKAAGDAVNWSAVAAEAFRRALLDLESRKGVRTMDEVVERLRASRAKARSEKYQQGLAAGERWAREDAEADELQALDRWQPSDSRNCVCNLADAVEEAADADDPAVGFMLWQAMHPNDEADWGQAKYFWEDAIADEQLIEDPGFALGFVEGALAVWGKVKNEL